MSSNSHFGKSLGKSGISGFIERLKSKAESAGLKVTEVKPYKLKLSQYDPYTDQYRKKSLNERWHSLGESSEWIQRDVMSALLLQCADLEEEKHIPTEVIKNSGRCETAPERRGICDIETIE